MNHRWFRSKPGRSPENAGRRRTSGRRQVDAGPGSSSAPATTTTAGGPSPRVCQTANTAAPTTQAARNPQVDGVCRPCVAPLAEHHRPGGHRPAPRHGTGQVQPLAAAAGSRRSSTAAPTSASSGEEQVDVQRPPPGQVRRQRPAQQQADRAARPGDRAEHAERLAAVLRILERVGQDRRADGAMIAAKAPWQARAVTSMTKLTDAPPTADTTARPAGPP